MQKKIDHIEEIIFRNISNYNFSVSLLAEQLQISTSHLREMVNEQFAMSPLRLIESIRLEKALQLLADGSSIDSARRQTGYTNPRTFRRTFKKRLSVTPSSCKQKLTTNPKQSKYLLKLTEKLWKTI